MNKKQYRILMRKIDDLLAAQIAVTADKKLTGNLKRKLFSLIERMLHEKHTGSCSRTDS